MPPEERPKAPPTTKKEATVKKQTVAGFVVCRKTDEGPKYLLLYRRGTYWNFPKGKFEEGDRQYKDVLKLMQNVLGLEHPLPRPRRLGGDGDHDQDDQRRPDCGHPCQ